MLLNNKDLQSFLSGMSMTNQTLVHSVQGTILENL